MPKVNIPIEGIGRYGGEHSRWWGRRMSKRNFNITVLPASMQNVIENFLFIICNLISLTKYV